MFMFILVSSAQAEDVSKGYIVKLSDDAIVMFSDGVREEDLPYLKKSFKDFKGGNIRGFTCELCENIRRYQDEKNDDLTVITLVLTNNE